jgi:hypothetical protein
MTTRTRAPKVSRTKKITGMARVFTQDLPRLAELATRCEKTFGGSFAQQHTVSKARTALEKELSEPTAAKPESSTTVDK